MNWKQRTVGVGVGELSRWVPGGTDSAGRSAGNNWAMREGQQWHNRLRERDESEYPNCITFETPIQGNRFQLDWKLSLDGRIDQWIQQNNEWRVREIKTVSEALPKSEVWLRTRYPEYFCQAGWYHELLGDLIPSGITLTTEIVFLERETGVIQIVSLKAEDVEQTGASLKNLVEHLEIRRETLHFWQTTRPQFHLEWRPEQAALIADWERVRKRGRSFQVEAPTGFGKTAVLWEWALRDLRGDETIDRVLYLTGRTSGQWQATQQLAQALGDNLPALPLYHLQRPRSEHCLHHTLHCVKGFCPFLENAPPRAAFWLGPDPLPRGGTVSLESWLEQGRQLGICPYELSRKVSPLAPVWIADYNYFLGRPSNQILRVDYEPARTVLVIDEAHNLEDRLLGHWTMDWLEGECLRLGEPLREAGAGTRLRQLWDQWRDALAKLPGGRLLKPVEIQWAEEILVELARQVERENWSWSTLPPELANGLWKVLETNQRLRDTTLGWDWVWWTPRNGVLQWAPLNIRDWLERQLQSFAKVYLASAYLPRNPLLPESSFVLRAKQPWREESFKVALDLRVDTRYMNRPASFQRIAQNFLDLIGQDTRPVVVFFPSYAYAEAVMTYAEALAPGVRVQLQARGLDSAGQRTFLEEGLLTAQGLFLILGSFASEGIDILGGKVSSAMIVSPALPEVTPLREVRREYWEKHSPGEGFVRSYQEPGLTRVQQAVGRLVRQPEHLARIVLVCSRYGKDSYNDLLDPLLAEGTRIEDESAWQSWLAYSRSHSG